MSRRRREGGDEEARVAELVEVLRAAERELQALTGGQLDAVMGVGGDAYLLEEAQHNLRDREARQRELAENLRAVLDALPAHIALVDEHGVILEVNEAWRHFGSANVLRTESYAVGVNYLEVCDRASGDCSEEAVSAAAGLRAVLRRELPLFSLEYPCHGPDERRWYRLMVTPLGGDANAGAVVMHVNVTERRLAEEVLRESERHYRMLFEGNPQPMWVFDLETLRFLAVNEAAVAKYGYSREQFAAMTLRDIRPAEDVPALEAEVRRAGNATLRGSLWRHLLADGRIVTAEVASQWIDFDGRPARLVMATDVTERLAAENALRESEREQRRLAWELDLERQRLVAAQSVAKIGSWETDLVSLDVLWSEQTHRIFETDPRTFAPTHARFLELVHPDDRATVDTAFRDSWATRELRMLEHRIVMPDGWIKHVEERWQTRTDAEGRPARALGTTQDITEQYLADEALRHSEERFRLLSRATNDAIWDWDLVTDALWWNEGFESLSGFSRDEVEPTIESWKSRIHPDDYERIVPDVGRAIAGGVEYWSGEYRFRHKSGKWIYVLDRGNVIRDASGKAVRMIGGMTDLTERRHAEERLAEQAALLDAAQEAIVVKDLEHRIQFWSRGAERTYGWKAAEAVGRTTTELLYGGDSSQPDLAMPRLLAEGHWQGEMRHLTSDRRERVVDVSWTLVRGEDGIPRSVLSINNDVTERRNLEALLLRAQRLESIGTLAGGIAHDLNNVLAPILMAIELLREGETRGERLELLSTLASSAQRGADMVRQVLSFARGMHGTKVRMDLRQVGRDVARILRDTFPKNIEIDVRLDETLWPITADATQMHQVLMNLCVNARDAMPEGGRLLISLENLTIDETYASLNPDARPGPYVLLKVADAGEGIAPEFLGRLFEPFFTTKDPGSGTGLGLSTVHTIVRGHGGFVHVYSEVGKGSKFKVYLPAIAETGEVEKVALDRSDLPRGRGECVLVVDDEESVREVMRRTLERFGYRVVLAPHGAEAVAIYAQRRAEIAVVLTDMSMPVMDGPATILALQAIDREVRVIATSGLAANGHVAKVAGAGVRHFVPKPYTAETLLRALRKALDEPV